MDTNNVNCRPNGLQFTHIQVKPIVRNHKYMALFKFGYKGQTLLMDTTIGGDSQQECIDKTEKFLNTKLEDCEYSIIE